MTLLSHVSGSVASSSGVLIALARASRDRLTDTLFGSKDEEVITERRVGCVPKRSRKKASLKVYLSLCFSVSLSLCACVRACVYECVIHTFFLISTVQCDTKNVFLHSLLTVFHVTMRPTLIHPTLVCLDLLF